MCSCSIREDTVTDIASSKRMVAVSARSRRMIQGDKNVVPPAAIVSRSTDVTTHAHAGESVTKTEDFEKSHANQLVFLTSGVVFDLYYRVSVVNI